MLPTTQICAEVQQIHEKAPLFEHKRNLGGVTATFWLWRVPPPSAAEVVRQVLVEPSRGLSAALGQAPNTATCLPPPER